MAQRDPRVQQLIDGYSVDGYWANHPDITDWMDEVANGETRQGFWEWLAAKNGITDD